ncbi:hypothetical protein PU01_20870 [Hafnia alvei]|nr:hypothetical protein PU01_20870 [Hafnia alvei]
MNLTTEPFEALSLRAGIAVKKSDIGFIFPLRTHIHFPAGNGLIWYVGNIVSRMYAMTEDL